MVGTPSACIRPTPKGAHARPGIAPQQSLQTRWSIRKLVDYTECATGRAARVESCRTPTTTRNLGSRGDLMESRIDLAADLNDEDDEGLGWTTLSEARDPGQIRPGEMLVVGNLQAQAVGRVVK